MGDAFFYGADQAVIHHNDFGKRARCAGERLLALLERTGHHHGTVVDLGCGSGIFARVMCEAGYNVAGVDISPEMIELAAEQAPAASFHCGSLLDADLPQVVGVAAIGEPLNYAPTHGQDLTNSNVLLAGSAPHWNPAWSFSSTSLLPVGLARMVFPISSTTASRGRYICALTTALIA